MVQCEREKTVSTKLDKVTGVRFTGEQWQLLQEAARQQGRTVSNLVRWIVMGYLEKKGREKHKDV